MSRRTSDGIWAGLAWSLVALVAVMAVVVWKSAPERFPDDDAPITATGSPKSAVSAYARQSNHPAPRPTDREGCPSTKYCPLQDFIKIGGFTFPLDSDVFWVGQYYNTYATLAIVVAPAPEGQADLKILDAGSFATAATVADREVAAIIGRRDDLWRGVVTTYNWVQKDQPKSVPIVRGDYDIAAVLYRPVNSPAIDNGDRGVVVVMRTRHAVIVIHSWVYPHTKKESGRFQQLAYRLANRVTAG